MKKGYIKPHLMVHGNVQKLTKVLGPLSTADTLSIGGQIIAPGDTSGSRDFTSS